jgi:hypothetical protein
MPIRPELRHLYNAPEARAARADVRIRAGGRCEWCGARDRYWICRNERGRPFHLPPAVAAKEASAGRRVVRVILTVAHLDRDPGNNQLDNLAHLCQRCHLNHDRPQHVYNARRTRADRRGQNWLLPEIAERL